MFDIITVGHIYKEIIKHPNQKITDPVLGGPAGYSAVVASLLGAKTGIVTKIGEDMPKHLTSIFNEVKVDAVGMKTVGEYGTSTLLTYDETGSKEVQYYHKSPDLLIDDFPEEYFNSRIIYLCPVDYEISINTIEELRKKGKFLAVDLMGFGGATCREHPGKEERRNHNLLKRLAKNIQIVRGSIEDCQYFFDDIEQEEAIPKLFVEWGATMGIVTLGDRGAIIANSEQQIIRIPPFNVNAVDCTGAGDSFTAGFLYEFIKTKDLYRAGLFGSDTASLVVEQPGGVSTTRMPTYEKVQARIVGEI